MKRISIEARTLVLCLDGPHKNQWVWNWQGGSLLVLHLIKNGRWNVPEGTLGKFHDCLLGLGTMILCREHKDLVPGIQRHANLILRAPWANKGQLCCKWLRNLPFKHKKPGSGSGSEIRIWIRNPDPKLDPDPGSGSRKKRIFDKLTHYPLSPTYPTRVPL